MFGDKREKVRGAYPGGIKGYMLPKVAKIDLARTWANAQRDGRPAEYRCRPPFNAA